MPARGLRLAKAAAAALLLLVGCTGTDGGPPPASTTTEDTATVSAPAPDVSRGDRGPVRDDLEPLARRFDLLADAQEVTWQGGVLGDPRAPGPSTYWIEAVVRPSEPALAEARRLADEPLGEPALADELAGAASDGPWTGGSRLDQAFAQAGYSGRVLLDDDAGVLVLLLIGGDD